MWKGMERTDLQSPDCQNVRAGPQRPESAYLLYAMSATHGISPLLSASVRVYPHKFLFASTTRVRTLTCLEVMWSNLAYLKRKQPLVSISAAVHLKDLERLNCCFTSSQGDLWPLVPTLDLRDLSLEAVPDNQTMMDVSVSQASRT